MSSEKEMLFDEILSGAAKTVLDNFPEELSVSNMMGGQRVRVANSFYKELNVFFQTNGVYTDETQIDEETRNMSRATLFTVDVLNSLYLTNRISNYIDNYLDNPENAHLYAGAEEKNQLKSELKKRVEDTFEVKTNSQEAKDYAQSLKDGFSAESYEKGMSCVYNINQSLTYPSGMNQLTSSQDYYQEAPDSITRKIVDGINAHSAEIAQEEKPVSKSIRGFSVFYGFGNGNEVNPADFVKHFNNSTLSDEEKSWAMNIYRDSLIDDRNIDKNKRFNIGFDDIKVDGKPMFSKEQLENPTDLMVCEVIARTLSGEKVTANLTDDREYLLSPKIEEISYKKEKHWYDFIVDFFKSHFGSGTDKEKSAKIDEMKSEIENTQDKFVDSAFRREKITFNDLFGKSALDKVTSASKQQPEKTNTLGKSK